MSTICIQGIALGCILINLRQPPAFSFIAPAAFEDTLNYFEVAETT